MYGVLEATWNLAPASKSSSVLVTGGDIPCSWHLKHRGYAQTINTNEWDKQTGGVAGAFRVDRWVYG